MKLKLKEFTREDCVQRSTGRPTLRITSKGVFSMSAIAIETIGLKKGDKVSILQDQNNPTDWYLCKTDNEFGFILRKTGVVQLVFNAANIASKIFKSLELNQGFTFPLATEPTEGKYYAILTHVALKKD